MQEIRLNSARNCFRYVIKLLNIKEIYIPYYLCSCMRHVAFEENCKIYFYHVDKNFYPDKDIDENSFILYPNYFGICSKNVQRLEKKYKNLIVDNAHSFYSEPYGIASFNSIRKFFPKIRDGAILYLSKIIKNNLQIDNYHYEPKILTYEEICKNEQRIEKSDIKLISTCSNDLYKKTNLEYFKNKRRNEFLKLHSLYKDKNLLTIKISEKDVPFCYPLLLDNEKIAEIYVKSFEESGKLIYKYWENMPDYFLESKFQKCLVPIPLD